MANALIRGSKAVPSGAPGDMLVSVLILPEAGDKRILYSWKDNEWVSSDKEYLYPGDQCTQWFLIRNPASSPDAVMKKLDRAMEESDHGQVRYYAENMRDWIMAGGRLPSGGWTRKFLLDTLHMILNPPK